MNLIFLSNFYNHHQGPLCRALAAQSGVSFRFLACGTISLERRAMWGEIRDLPDFVVTPRTPAEWVVASREILEADAVIVGSAPQILLRERLREGKLILRFQERPLKNGLEPLKFLPRMVKWGYFPAVLSYDTEALLSQKEPSSIFWAGRLLDLKHPDDAIRLAARLRDAGYSFSLRIAGSGTLEPKLRGMIAQYALESQVCLLGSLSPEQVRREMERSAIFLFTSDRHEGWGAVLNEAMNSGCAVVASDAAGSTPYLVENSVNGCVYRAGNRNELYENVVRLLEQPSTREAMGKHAYETITNTWNAQEAARRLVDLIRAISEGVPSPELYSEGPCSRA